MLLRIIGIIFPVFAVVGAGWLYARFRQARSGIQGGIDMSFANQLNMEIFVPALVFSALTSKGFHLASYDRLALAAAGVVLGSGVIAWGLSRLLREDPKTFVPPMMFTNSGNMGLPLMVFAFGEDALQAAVVLFFVENTLHYTLGAWMLDHQVRLLTLWRVPVIFATLVAFSIKLTGLEIWQPLYQAIKLLGDIAIPLLLFSLGVRLATSRWSDMRLGLIGALVCPLSGILLAWALTPLFGLGARDAAMLLIFGALPPAVLNFVFAERYRQEPAKVASLVMIGNLGSLLFVPLALALTLR